MLITLTLGVVTSILSEVIVWVNKKLSGTVLAGKGAFLLALTMSLIAASYKLIWMDHSVDLSWEMIGTTFAQIWTVAQVFFIFIVETFGFDIQADKPLY